jgi:hypothetical protein
VPSSPAITPAGAGTANSTATTLTVEQVSSLLTNLQSSLEQTLPVLTAFVAGFDFVPVATNGVTPAMSLAHRDGQRY